MNPYETLVEKNPYETLVEPTPVQRAGRVAGLGARALVKGASAIPALMADAIAYPLNKLTGGRYFEQPSAVLDRTLTEAGLPQPETPVERVATDVTGAMTGMGGQLAVLRGMASPVAQQMSQMPLQQLTGAATGAGASGVVREAGGGPAAQLVAGVAGSMAPFTPTLARGAKPLTPTEQAAIDAHAAGYTIPPTQSNPSVLNRVLEGTAGKITTAQQA
jgi:hypothetical protein